MDGLMDGFIELTKTMDPGTQVRVTCTGQANKEISGELVGCQWNLIILQTGSSRVAIRADQVVSLEYPNGHAIGQMESIPVRSLSRQEVPVGPVGPGPSPVASASGVHSENTEPRNENEEERQAYNPVRLDQQLLFRIGQELKLSCHDRHGRKWEHLQDSIRYLMKVHEFDDRFGRSAPLIKKLDGILAKCSAPSLSLLRAYLLHLSGKKGDAHRYLMELGLRKELIDLVVVCEGPEGFLPEYMTPYLFESLSIPGPIQWMIENDPLPGRPRTEEDTWQRLAGRIVELQASISQPSVLGDSHVLLDSLGRLSCSTGIGRIMPSTTISRNTSYARHVEPLKPVPGGPDNPIHSFLSDRGLIIKDTIQNPTFYLYDKPDVMKIIEYIGLHYEWILPVYRAIRSCMQDGGKFTLNCTGYNNKIITTCMQFCSLLQQAGFMTGYKYSNNPHIQISGKVSSAPEFQGLMSGGWLEYYAHSMIEETLLEIEASKGPYEWTATRNVSAVLRDGTEVEFDILVLADGILYWVEAKTGVYKDSITKYNCHATHLEMDRSRAFLLATEATSVDIRKDHGLITVVDLTTFRERFRSSVSRGLRMA